LVKRGLPLVRAAVGVPETLWFSTDNGPGRQPASKDAGGAILINQPQPQYVGVTYNVPVDFNYIINILTAALSQRRWLFQDGRGPYTQISASPIRRPSLGRRSGTPAFTLTFKSHLSPY